MKLELAILDRQRSRRIDVPRLRRLAERLLRDELGLAEACLGIHLVGARTMARLNWRWLRHSGSTDVITFDHHPSPPSRRSLHGELFVSIDDAVVQARHFSTTPALELVRYVIHGCLHLLGFDDLDPANRRVMKREENRLVRRLARVDSLARLVTPRTPPRRRSAPPCKKAPPASSSAPGR